MRGTYLTGNEIVDEVARINISGNVIPLIWFHTLKGESGKPMLLSIDILADIVYWYRPKEIRDEGSGELIGYQKKFKADLLQRSYRQIETRFGVTKKQARNALDFLCEIGVIKKHLRDEVTPDGYVLHNNMYLELVPDRLKELTYPQRFEHMPLVLPPSALEECRMVTPRADGDILKGTTNTEITYQEYKQSINVGIDEMDKVNIYEEIIKDNIEYEYLIQENNGLDKVCIDEIVSLLVEIVSIKRKSVFIGGVAFPYEVVKGQLLKLNSEHICYVLDCMRQNKTKVKNIKNYILTALYNAPNTVGNFYRAEVNHDLYGGRGQA